jgi:hypothetical protein
MGWFQRPRGLRRGSAAARLLELRVRIPSGAWMSVCYEYCVLGTGLCGGPIPHPKESYPSACVSFGVIRCNNNPLHLQWVGRRGQTKKERKEGRKEGKTMCAWYCNTEVPRSRSTEVCRGVLLGLGAEIYHNDKCVNECQPQKKLLLLLLKLSSFKFLI